jgi:hypothetical protein
MKNAHSGEEMGTFQVWLPASHTGKGLKGHIYEIEAPASGPIIEDVFNL